MALTNCPECGDRVSSASPKCPNCGLALVGTSDAASHEPKTPDAVPPKAATPASRAQPRSQSNWVVGIVVAAVLGVILVGLVAAVFLVESISITNPFEEAADVEVAPTTTLAAATTLAPTTTLASEGDNSYGLLVGDCINDDALERYIAGDEYERIPCDLPHGNEVYYVYEFPPGSYPGQDAVRDDLISVCEDEFEGYVGRDYESSSLDVYATWPGPDLWASGTRIGECLLYDLDLDDLTGSAYQSGW